jgi:Protein of unknown function (DUF1353)
LSVEVPPRTFNVEHYIVTTLKALQPFAAAIILALLTSCASNKKLKWIAGAEQSHKWGYYSDLPATRWDADGRSMTLLNELRYTDPQGMVWIAPAGSKVDGASIPRSLWSIMGGPFEGKYRNASVLHDVAYEQHNRPWQDCDRMFYNAMRCSGVGGVEAGTMYYALYKFGHHWKFTIKRAKPVKEKELAAAIAEQVPKAIPVNQGDISETRDWIRSAEPSLEQIEQRADAETQ